MADISLIFAKSDRNCLFERTQNFLHLDNDFLMHPLFAGDSSRQKG
jgi:hypothetical protein